jgi:hypothetical protein
MRRAALAPEAVGSGRRALEPLAESVPRRALRNWRDALNEQPTDVVMDGRMGIAGVGVGAYLGYGSHSRTRAVRSLLPRGGRDPRRALVGSEDGRHRAEEPGRTPDRADRRRAPVAPRVAPAPQHEKRGPDLRPDERRALQPEHVERSRSEGMEGRRLDRPSRAEAHLCINLHRLGGSTRRRCRHLGHSSVTSQHLPTMPESRSTRRDSACGAEREGFEPSTSLTTRNGFRDRRIRPLCHLSERRTA